MLPSISLGEHEERINGPSYRLNVRCRESLDLKESANHINAENKNAFPNIRRRLNLHLPPDNIERISESLT